MPEQTAYRFDVSTAAVALAELHEQVVLLRKRIELTRDGECCVLISKVELDGLERALEILADTDGFRAMSHEIALLAATAQRHVQVH